MHYTSPFLLLKQDHVEIKKFQHIFSKFYSNLILSVSVEKTVVRLYKPFPVQAFIRSLRDCVTEHFPK